jgi:hypothetical protein
MEMPVHRLELWLKAVGLGDSIYIAWILRADYGLRMTAGEGIDFSHPFANSAKGWGTLAIRVSFVRLLNES